MRGKLAQINLRSLLRLLESEQQTGALYVETTAYFPNRLDLVRDNYALIPRLKPQSWLIFLVNGRITYATNTSNIDLTRIQDYLSYYQLEKLGFSTDNFAKNSTNTPEYNYLIYLIQQKSISLQQAQKIIYKLIKETLLELLISPLGDFSFEFDWALPSAIADWETRSLISTVYSELKTWKQLYPQIQSPAQYPIFKEPTAIAKATSIKTQTTLANWIDKKISLMRLARQINCQTIDLAKALYPYIQKGWIGLKHHEDLITHNAPTIEPTQKARIVFVDNDVAIAKKVEYILKRRGYESTIFADSILALTDILHNRPNLVFCKMNLPQLSGDRLCNTIKNSSIGRQTKVVMLGKQDNFCDRLRARLVSADDYLSLPVSQSELLVLVEKHLDINYNQPLALVQQQSLEKSNFQH